MSFFDRIGRSWELVKASWGVLKQDKELIWFPIMSLFGVIAVTIAFAIPLFASGLVEAVVAEEGTAITQSQQILGFVLAFLFYLVMYTVIIFSNVALVGAAMMRLNGEDPTVRDGFRIASERIGSIIGYAAISATVGMILNAIRDEDNFLSQILAGILSTAWNLIVFLVIPILVIEKVGPIEAIKRCGNLLKKTWGEQVIGTFSMGIIFMLISLAAALLIGVPVLGIASATGSGIVMGIGIAVVVFVIMAINLVGTAMNGIFQAALYNYATTGEAGEFFERQMIEGAFQPK